MPSPVEALPCGSRSTISTCSPMAAIAVPRLIAVAVLPTPPFWLAIASTRGRGPSPLRAGLAKGTTCGSVAGESVIGLSNQLLGDRGFELIGGLCGRYEP